VSSDLSRQLIQLCDELVRAASRADSAALTRWLDEQKRFVASHPLEMDEAAFETLRTSQQKALLSAKIGRARILETLEANKRSLGVLQAYRITASL
jgi:hypothetical protein